MADDKSAGRIALGSDHAGFRLKESIKERLRGRGDRVIDFGTDREDDCDYPDFALRVAQAVRAGEASRGVLICGTGVGMAMVANKVPGVRAAVCNDEVCARFSRLHNDANVLTMGARLIDTDKALNILDVFLGSEYEGSEVGGERHARRLEKIRDVESLFMFDAGER